MAFDQSVSGGGQMASEIEAVWGDEGDQDPVRLANAPGSMSAKLDLARKDLLDLGLRNPLLSYRPLRARGVEITNERAVDVFNILVHQKKSTTFLPLRDSEGEPLGQPGGDGEDELAARRTDTRLQTAESSTKLQSRLLATYYAARTSIEEQGINTLFLALGALRWYDRDDPSQPRRAPLVLVPVGLERSNAAARFHVRFNGDDIGPNLTLEEKLKTEFGIILPQMPDPEELDVAAYFDEVADEIQGEPTWSVEHNAISLGFFSFAKLLMFRDLDPATWPDDQDPLDHPILRALLGQGFRTPPSEISDDAHLDAYDDATNLHAVLDADSSQMIAMLDVKSGHDLVIQGPPGTGKSQTITNIIAEALADGRTVLFVAEKLAALEVVKRRLDKTGLGDACLELHSHNGQKKALLAELRRTLELGRPLGRDAKLDRLQLAMTREKLNAYSAAVNGPVGQSGVSPHQALGHVVRLRQQYGENSLPRIPESGLAGWDAARFRNLEVCVGELQATLRACGPPSAHPFRGSRLSMLTPADEDAVRSRLQGALEAVTALERAVAALARMLQVELPSCRAEIDSLMPRAWEIWRAVFGKDRRARAIVQNALTHHRTCVQGVVEALKLDERLQFGGDVPLLDKPFREQQQILWTWLERLGELRTLVAFNAVASQCESEGYSATVWLARTWPVAANMLAAAAQYTWFYALLDRAYREREPLARFSRETHEHALAEFRKLDELMAPRNSEDLARAHWEGLPRENGRGQLATLKREFEKKARHLPIRQLMLKAGRPIQAIKPVFMMSPLSIANYLPPGSVTFDLVIFDEASQVRPVDAFGALIRGRQAVVVGDTRQLPPTSFFDSLIKGDEEPEDEESVTSDIESVLGIFAAQLAPQRMLRWHYRSRHESLIAVSNHVFYDDRLVVFPSPDAGREEVGLRLRHVPHGVYSRGTARTNPIEAKAVAEAVMEHARNSPELTLGVAAFSVAQMRAIQDELELLRREDPSTEVFFMNAHPHEGFFVKNLETVQGDERDVILISVGYGRAADGYLSMSFGPLNRDGGERRLNVLITRARIRCEVFTGLTADDIDDTGRGPGVRALKIFLRYAQDGYLDVPIADGREADSPFEEAVYHELAVLRGYQVRKQVGSGGFRIDLAVVDPDHPGRYLLGIECDGASYHSARSARDRDRLRQRVLENLGWQIHRIWSTDWFRDPQSEIRRVIDPIEAGRLPNPAAAPGAQPVRRTTESRIEREDVASEQDTTSLPRYVQAELSLSLGGRELHTLDRRVLADWVARVVAVESPVHVQEVSHRIAEAAGVHRVGSRIQLALDEAIRQADARAVIRRHGDFLWSPTMRVPVVRNRSGLDAASRGLHLVAPEEIDVAICRVVGLAYGIRREDIPTEVGRMLGFGRVSEDMRETIDRRVQTGLAGGSIVGHNGYIALPARGT